MLQDPVGVLIASIIVHGSLIIGWGYLISRWCKPVESKDKSHTSDAGILYVGHRSIGMVGDWLISRLPECSRSCAEGAFRRARAVP